jgi:hypothetical protein
MKGRIEIQGLADAFRGFRAAWKAAAVGKLVTPRHGTSFTSLEAARKVLTSRRPAPPGALDHRPRVPEARPRPVLALPKPSEVEWTATRNLPQGGPVGGGRPTPDNNPP